MEDERELPAALCVGDTIGGDVMLGVVGLPDMLPPFVNGLTKLVAEAVGLADG